MNMIEKVARAMYKDYDWGILHDHKELMHRTAKAAIEAMREPAYNLLEFDTKCGNLFDWKCNCNYCGGYQFAIQAYIDEALKDG